MEMKKTHCRMINVPKKKVKKQMEIFMELNEDESIAQKTSGTHLNQF